MKYKILFIELTHWYSVFVVVVVVALRSSKPSVHSTIKCKKVIWVVTVHIPLNEQTSKTSICFCFEKYQNSLIKQMLRLLYYCDGLLASFRINKTLFINAKQS